MTIIPKCRYRERKRRAQRGDIEGSGPCGVTSCGLAAVKKNLTIISYRGIGP